MQLVLRVGLGYICSLRLEWSPILTLRLENFDQRIATWISHFVGSHFDEGLAGLVRGARVSIYRGFHDFPGLTLLRRSLGIQFEGFGCTGDV